MLVSWLGRSATFPNPDRKDASFDPFRKRQLPDPFESSKCSHDHHQLLASRFGGKLFSQWWLQYLPVVSVIGHIASLQIPSSLPEKCHHDATTEDDCRHRCGSTATLTPSEIVPTCPWADLFRLGISRLTFVRLKLR